MMYAIGLNCGIPGVMIIAPAFDFYDAADAAKTIEVECNMDARYEDHSSIGRACALRFARDSIPLGYWL